MLKHSATIAERIREYRTRNKLTLSDLESMTGVPAQTINRYELGQRVPKIDAANEMAEAMRVNPMWLQGYDVPMDALPSEGIPYEENYFAPIVGSIPAGYPTLAFQDIIGYASIPYHDGERYFFLRVNGDSMIGAGINTGDLVLIRQQHCAENGQIVAARVNGDEATLKRYRKQGSSVLLMPENPAYEPRIVSAKDFETGDAEIIGVALEVRHQL